MEHSKRKCESVPTVLFSLAALHHMSVKCSKGGITHQALCWGVPQCRRLNTYNTSCKAGQNCPRLPAAIGQAAPMGKVYRFFPQTSDTGTHE